MIGSPANTLNESKGSAMGTNTERAYCRTCEAPVLAVKRTPSHVLHLLLSVVTAGLWILVWLWADRSHGRTQLSMHVVR